MKIADKKVTFPSTLIHEKEAYRNISDEMLYFLFALSMVSTHTLLCLNIGTPKNHIFSIWDKWKINGFRCPNTIAL